MTTILHTTPLAAPRAPVNVTAESVVTGLPIPPIERIRIFSSTQWEDFVLEWADSLRNTYGLVERCGGAGDMGRDIVACDKNNPSIWDNYQCKHYRSGLMPSEIWLELGKLVYYTHRREYTYPRCYFFVAPQGAGTTLSNLLKKPDKLKKELIENWDKYCTTGITSTSKIELDTSLRTYLDSLDFSIFDSIPPLRLIDQHAQTRWHIARFGGALPPRPAVETPPIDVADHEANYVRQLLDAYGDYLKRDVSVINDLTGSNDLQEHFSDSRLEFYSAESLRAFSRDTLPSGTFEQLQFEVHSGIKDDIRADHSDGYRRVTAVVKTARSLQLAGHPLNTRLSTLDRGGICHQLANDGKVKWKK